MQLLWGVFVLLMMLYLLLTLYWRMWFDCWLGPSFFSAWRLKKKLRRWTGESPTWYDPFHMYSPTVVLLVYVRERAGVMPLKGFKPEEWPVPLKVWLLETIRVGGGRTWKLCFADKPLFQISWISGHSSWFEEGGSIEVHFVNLSGTKYISSMTEHPYDERDRIRLIGKILKFAEEEVEKAEQPTQAPKP